MSDLFVALRSLGVSVVTASGSNLPPRSEDPFKETALRSPVKPPANFSLAFFRPVRLPKAALRSRLRATLFLGPTWI